MNAVERDSVTHKLGTTAEFYGKTIEPSVGRIWLKALRDQPAQQVLDAFDQHIQRGKYMPRPVDILDIVDISKAQARNLEPKAAANESKPCSKRVNDAWTWFIGMYTEDSSIGRVFSKRDYTAEQEEEMLLLVNKHAKHDNNPEAIPDEYKLKEIWT